VWKVQKKKHSTVLSILSCHQLKQSAVIFITDVAIHLSSYTCTNLRFKEIWGFSDGEDLDYCLLFFDTAWSYYMIFNVLENMPALSEVMSTLKMDKASYFETSITMYQSIRCHNPVTHNWSIVFLVCSMHFMTLTINKYVCPYVVQICYCMKPSHCY
jgi:hypothetical protein